MSQLELEVLEKYQQLDPDSKRRIKAIISDDEFVIERARPNGPSLQKWLQQVDALKRQIAENHGGEMPVLDVVQTLHEVRDNSQS